MGAAKVKLNPIGLGFFNALQNLFPGFFFARHHEGDHHGPVRPFAFDFFDLGKIYIERAIGDQLDVVQP